MNEEIIELESKLAFQEDALLQLNITVTKQQIEIAELKRALEELRETVRHLNPSPLGGEPEPPPPHY